LALSKETGIPLVATNDCHYTYKEDAEAHDVLLALSESKLVSDDDRQKDELGEWYVKSEEEMRALFSYAQEAVDNTQKIADMCNVEFEFHNTKMPKCPLPEGKTAEMHLRDVCEKGFETRYSDKSEEEKKLLRSQMDYQLSVIKEMGYIEYFLIVQEYCNWARDNGIAVGPGRGSAAGSIVTYCTGITDIEPTQYDLQFERFLNPERVSTPDVDIDFDIRGRGDVVEHCKKIYGDDNVVQIITFGRMEAKAVLKDVGKALGFPYDQTNAITKLIPNGTKNLKAALTDVPDFKSLYDSDKGIKRLVDMAMKLESLPKSTGTHAAGVIISDKPTREYIPLTKTADRTGVVSQYTMTYVEELGLLKMDFLGLRTLTVIEDAKENIRKSRGIDIDLKKIDYDDQDVYAFISSGSTDGVFQLESKGMQGFMKNLKPTCIEDIIAGVSLYRPGPMDFIPQYIEGKNSGKEIVYDTPELEPILKPTYGCIVYQEQVTQIVRDLAGYSMGAADNIRRAMSKKKQYVIDEERKYFVGGDPKRNIPGCVANGISEAIANKIYDHMVDFAKYAFNKSHAACYGIIAYQTAWLMYHYPTEYFAAIETSVIGNADKLSAYMGSAKGKGIKNLRPDINLSGSRFLPENDKIRMALCSVSAVSDDTACLIEKDRQQYGPFKDTADAFDRLAALKIGADAIENLIYAGAFDEFEGTRKQKVSVCRDYIDNRKKVNQENIEGQMSLFDIMPSKAPKLTFPSVGEYSAREKLIKEKDATGI
ncbi:MAG: DNA polymerase III subunit alpha, partial [Clostridium sp.]|nr:DNA polymerase III subunit alpha [Clostridium sp.]